VAALSLSDYTLNVELGATPSTPIIRSLSASGSPLTLRASAIGTATNDPLQVAIHGSLGLHIRPGIQLRPSSLIMANAFTVASPLQITLPSGRLHTLVERLQLDCRGTSALVCGEREPYSGIFPPEIDSKLVSEMTYPAVVAAGATNLAYISKAGDAYLLSAGASPDIETLATTGAPITMPLIAAAAFANSGETHGAQWFASIDGALGALSASCRVEDKYGTIYSSTSYSLQFPGIRQRNSATASSAESCLWSVGRQHYCRRRH
jgi:hypothetical protein